MVNMSLRMKILLVLTIVPTLTLAFFLAIALQVFESDKVAFVYESTSTLAGSISSQVSSDLSSAIVAVKPIVQDYLLTTQFGEISHSLMDSSVTIESVIIWRMVDGQPTVQAQIDRAGLAHPIVPSQISGLNEILQKAGALNVEVKMPFNDQRLLLVQKIDVPGKDQYYGIITQITDAEETFGGKGKTEVYLIDVTGKILFSPDESRGESIASVLGTDFATKVMTAKFKQYSEEITLNKTQRFIVSYAKSDYFGLTAVTVVPRVEALKAMKKLVQKSILYFCVILCFVVMLSLFASGKLTAALGELLSATQSVAEGKFNISVPVTAQDEIGSLAKSFNAMASEVARLMLDTAAKARMENELKTAQTVQETLFPPNRAEFAGCRIIGHYEPASECGGDWWHFYEKDRKIFLFIGDATGHGAPAALITSAARSASTIMERLDLRPSQALELLNRAIHDVSKGKILMTFFIARYDLDTQILTYSNASHESPLLLRQKSGKLSKKDFVPLNAVNAYRLGQFRDGEYAEAELVLEPGDRIFFYTDGIVDLQNKKQEIFGERRLLTRLLRSNENFPVLDNVTNEVIKEVADYRQGASLVDDVTFFYFEVTPNDPEPQTRMAAAEI